MQQSIYAVLDLKSEDIIGGIHLHKADAAAVRAFTELLRDPNASIVGKYPEDFTLVKLGSLQEDLSLHSDYQVILTGQDWVLEQHKRHQQAQGETN